MSYPVDDLDAHAGALPRSRRGRDDGSLGVPDPSAEAVPGLTSLAESVQDALAPVRAPRAFVDELMHWLSEAAETPPIEITPPHSPSWVVGAAAVGSALSLLGLYRLLRGAHHPLERAS